MELDALEPFLPGKPRQYARQLASLLIDRFPTEHGDYIRDLSNGLLHAPS